MNDVLSKEEYQLLVNLAASPEWAALKGLNRRFIDGKLAELKKLHFSDLQQVGRLQGGIDALEQVERWVESPRKPKGVT